MTVCRYLLSYKSISDPASAFIPRESHAPRSEPITATYCVATKQLSRQLQSFVLHLTPCPPRYYEGSYGCSVVQLKGSLRTANNKTVGTGGQAAHQGCYHAEEDTDCRQPGDRPLQLGDSGSQCSKLRRRLPNPWRAMQ